MEIEIEKHQELIGDNPRYFLGDMKDGAFQKTMGYMVGFFMKGKVTEGGESMDILVRDDVECAIMDLPQTDPSPPHYHALGYEVTYCLSGRLNLIIDQAIPVKLTENQFLVIPPGTVLQNPENDPGTRVFVVKAPSVPNDKFYAE